MRTIPRWMKKSSSSDRSGSSPPSACCPRMGNPCALAAGRLISWLRSLSAPARRSRAWPGTVVEGAALSVHVAALSKALGDGSAGKRYIATLSGRGYALIAPVTGENAKSAAGCFAQAAEMARRTRRLVLGAAGRPQPCPAVARSGPFRRGGGNSAAGL